MKTIILEGTVVLVLAALLVVAISYGTQKQDQIDCLKWQQEAGTYSAPYFITQAQKDQCDYYGITINAPVK